jgi:DNA-binding CsgD family transcriptional regulator
LVKTQFPHRISIPCKGSSIWFGIAMAALLVLLKVFEYHYFARHLRLEIYLGAVALLFGTLGAWLARHFLAGKTPPATPPLLPGAGKDRGEQLKNTGLSQREMEILELMARGHTNQQIADALFISLNTVKTHASNLFAKLDVRRRTQAVRRARELQLLD